MGGVYQEPVAHQRCVFAPAMEEAGHCDGLRPRAMPSCPGMPLRRPQWRRCLAGAGGQILHLLRVRQALLSPKLRRSSHELLSVRFGLLHPCFARLWQGSSGNIPARLGLKRLRPGKATVPQLESRLVIVPFCVAFAPCFFSRKRWRFWLAGGARRGWRWQCLNGERRGKAQLAAYLFRQ